MRASCKALFLGLACCVAALAYCQDSPPLGDAARQARQHRQKQPAKDGQGKEAATSKSAKVITNDEIPEHTATRSGEDSTLSANDSSFPASGAGKLPAEQWKSQIQAQKNAVTSLQSEIDKLNDSIHFASGNCVANCVQWNERQKEKQAEIERMRAQLEDQKRRLEDMQESARQQGYGSSVYDP